MNERQVRQEKTSRVEVHIWTDPSSYETETETTVSHRVAERLIAGLGIESDNPNYEQSMKLAQEASKMTVLELLPVDGLTRIIVRGEDGTIRTFREEVD